jgi:phytanoyl-CoA hydroxylase
MNNNQPAFKFRIGPHHDEHPNGPNSNTNSNSNSNIAAYTSTGSFTAVPSQLIDRFNQDGFVVLPDALSSLPVNAMNDRLEQILRGRYDRGSPPDKTPKLIKPAVYQGPLGFSGNLTNIKVLQVINVHKCDALFRTIATDPALGHLVATLAGWTHGARLAQDQVWTKPPGASALVFHRDSPYFMFTPSDVVTVWLALDDMDAELGPLEYVKGSHKWGDGRVGTSIVFFDNGKDLLQSAAEREGITAELEIVTMAGLKAGGLSIHHGRTWHGSGKNASLTRPRRGLGMHFVPAQVRFNEDARKSRLWKRYVDGVKDPATVELPEEDFPLTWRPLDDV